MQGTMPGARRRGRPRTVWMDNIKTWTGLSVEESIRMTEGTDKWRKYVHGVANRRIARTAKEQRNRTGGVLMHIPSHSWHSKMRVITSLPLSLKQKAGYKHSSA